MNCLVILPKHLLEVALMMQDSSSTEVVKVLSNLQMTTAKEWKEMGLASELRNAALQRNNSHGLSFVLQEEVCHGCHVLNINTEHKHYTVT